MLQKLKKQIFSLFFIITFIFLMASCPSTDLSKNDAPAIIVELEPNSPEEEIPETSGGDIPVIQLPEDDSELRGDADAKDADTVITLLGTSAEFTGKNVNVIESAVYGTIVEITGNGIYIVQGTLFQGFVAVSKKELDVTIILNGVNIVCKNYAALTCLKKSNITLVLAENSTNYLTDGGEGIVDGKYPLGYDDEEQPNAVLLIRKDLTIKGTGNLIINGIGNNGIGSRANLRIESGNITVNAVNNALKGTDSITILGGRFNLVSQNDAIKTESTEDGLGAINISGGEFEINAVNDAVQAAASLSLADAVLKIKTGGGSTAAVSANSAKGLKAGTEMVLNSGIFDIDSNDDCIHSNGSVSINGGIFTLSSGDDGIHADTSLTINGGTIDIRKCYEGLESYNVFLNGGFVKLKASDDAINVSTGNDASAAADNRPGQGSIRPGQPGMPGGGMSGGPGGGQEEIIDGTLTITGGEYYVESTGDGLDSNGYIIMTGGTVVVHGPTAEPDIPIDYDKTFEMTGGTLIALGYHGNMAQQPGSSSTQYTFMAIFSSSVAAGTLINVSSSSGTEIVTVKAAKSTRGIAVCSPLLEKGTYTIRSGGTHSGTENHLGLFTGGSYSGGTVQKTFTISNIVTKVN